MSNNFGNGSFFYLTQCFSHSEHQPHGDSPIPEGSTDAGNSPVTENIRREQNSHFKISQRDSDVYTHKRRLQLETECTPKQLNDPRSQDGFEGNYE